MQKDLKPIETIYKGYKFRSRLEARWAVFFDTLGVPWEYEKEGYNLEGIWYLPDFWLPTLDCWFEVKGQLPTDQEWEKAYLLALYSGKDCYIARGIPMPDDGDTYISGAEGVNVFTDYYGKMPLQEKMNLLEPLDLPRDIVVTLMRIWQNGLDVLFSWHRRERLGEDGFYVDTHGTYCGYALNEALQQSEKQHKELQRLIPALLDHKDEILACIPAKGTGVKTGFTFCCMGGGTLRVKWTTCKRCKKAALFDPDFQDYPKASCQCFVADSDETSVIEAYTAARQARFGRGERG